MIDESASFGSHADYFRDGPYSELRQEHRSVGTTPLRLFRVYKKSDGTSTVPSMPEYAVRVVTRGVRGWAKIDLGAGRFAADLAPGNFLLSPPGVQCTYALDGRPDLLMICVPAPAFDALSVDADAAEPQGVGLALPAILHAGPQQDPFIERLCLRLWAEAQADNPYGGLFADGAVLALKAALLRLSGQRISKRRNCGGLAPWQLRRVTEAMDRAESETPSLANLAALVGLSPSYFCTAFRESTGVPPHTWQRTRRVERAQGLLAQSDLPVAEVALACGFANQSHFTRVFREVTGSTPARFRDAARF
jgi:AraC family transcriptional regulator